MTLNLRRLMSYIRRDLQQNWRAIDIEYKTGDGKIDITANLTLKNMDDDIRFIITIYEGGGSNFRAVFDKIEKTPGVLNLVNEFNNSNISYWAFVRDDGYLELRHWFFCFNEDVLKSYANEMLWRLSKLADDSTLQTLTRHTH